MTNLDLKIIKAKYTRRFFFVITRHCTEEMKLWFFLHAGQLTLTERKRILRKGRKKEEKKAQSC